MSGKKSFEESLEELETIVSGLESGKLDLENSLEEFEKGVSLYKDCKNFLGKTEKRIAILSESLKEENLED